MLSVTSLLTCGGVRWSKLQRVAQHVVVVPDIKLVISWIVVHRGDVLIRVRESDVDRLLTSTVGVVGVHHQVTTRLAVIILVDRAHRVKHPTRHEGVGCHPLVKAGLPGAFKAQSVRVHLQGGNAEPGMKNESRKLDSSVFVFGFRPKLCKKKERSNKDLCMKV